MNNDLIRKRTPWDLGTWLWLLNRIAGVIVIVYLAVHICVISSTRMGAQAFDGVMASLHNPKALALELLLILAVVAHGLNGLRHICIDFGMFPPAKHKFLFNVIALVGVLIFIVSAGVMWPYLSGGR